MPDAALIERARTLDFVLHWFVWQRKHGDDLSKQSQNKIGFGYRAGVFYPHGAKFGQHHDDFPPLFNQVAPLGLPLMSIEALFCYLTYPSCRVFIDTSGGTYLFP